MTSGLVSPAAARPSQASHISGSYSVARLKARAAYWTSRSVSSPSMGMPSENTPASNTFCASLVPLIGGDLSPHFAGHTAKTCGHTTKSQLSVSPDTKRTSASVLSVSPRTALHFQRRSRSTPTPLAAHAYLEANDLEVRPNGLRGSALGRCPRDGLMTAFPLIGPGMRAAVR